jgi:uncharacterized membrane protein
MSDDTSSSASNIAIRPARAAVPAGVAWPLITMIAAAVVGLGISIYLTITHYQHVAPVCTTTSVINCADVLASKFSTLPGTGKNGIPITIPGMIWFIVSGGLALYALLRARRGEPEPARLRLYHLLWATVGLLFVLYLVYDEIVQLHAICEWCTGVHILTLLTFILAWYRFAYPNAGLAQQEPEPDYRDLPPVRKHTSNTAHGTTLPRSMRNKVAQGNRAPARARSRR